MKRCWTRIRVTSGGRFLFGKGLTHAALTEWFTDEAVVKKTKLSEEYGLDEMKARYAGRVLPLFLITEEGNLQIFTAESKTSPQAGQFLISLMQPQFEIIEPEVLPESDKPTDTKAE